MAKDYYEILGVPKDASQSDIKNAFRQQARKLHPDVNKAPDAEERFNRAVKKPAPVHFRTCKEAVELVLASVDEWSKLMIE